MHNTQQLLIEFILECLRAQDDAYVLYMCFFFFKQKTAYEIGVRLVGSEMCIRDRTTRVSPETESSDPETTLPPSHWPR